MDTKKMDFKEAVQCLRTGDQRAIAKACRVSEQLVSKVANGERPNRLVKAAIIAQAEKNLKEEKNIASLLTTSIKRKRKNKKRLLLATVGKQTRISPPNLFNQK